MKDHLRPSRRGRQPRNDISQRMRNIARAMTPQKLEQAAAYCASQSPNAVSDGLNQRSSLSWEPLPQQTGRLACKDGDVADASSPPCSSLRRLARPTPHIRKRRIIR
jgi:hypothetical protein